MGICSDLMDQLKKAFEGIDCTFTEVERVDRKEAYIQMRFSGSSDEDAEQKAKKAEPILNKFLVKPKTARSLILLPDGTKRAAVYYIRISFNLSQKVVPLQDSQLASLCQEVQAAFALSSAGQGFSEFQVGAAAPSVSAASTSTTTVTVPQGHSAKDSRFEKIIGKIVELLGPYVGQASLIAGKLQLSSDHPLIGHCVIKPSTAEYTGSSDKKSAEPVVLLIYPKTYFNCSMLAAVHFVLGKFNVVGVDYSEKRDASNCILEINPFFPVTEVSGDGDKSQNFANLVETEVRWRDFSIALQKQYMAAAKLASPAFHMSVVVEVAEDKLSYAPSLKWKKNVPVIGAGGDEPKKPPETPAAAGSNAQTAATIPEDVVALAGDRGSSFWKKALSGYDCLVLSSVPNEKDFNKKQTRPAYIFVKDKLLYFDGKSMMKVDCNAAKVAELRSGLGITERDLNKTKELTREQVDLILHAGDNKACSLM